MKEKLLKDLETMVLSTVFGFGGVLLILYLASMIGY